jgi:hypothetical protein
VNEYTSGGEEGLVGRLQGDSASVVLADEWVIWHWDAGYEGDEVLTKIVANEPPLVLAPEV